MQYGGVLGWAVFGVIGHSPYMIFYDIAASKQAAWVGHVTMSIYFISRSIRNTNRFMLPAQRGGGFTCHQLLRGQFESRRSPSTLDRVLFHLAPEYLPRRRSLDFPRIPSPLSESLCHRVCTAAGLFTRRVWLAPLAGSISLVMSDRVESRKKLGVFGLSSPFDGCLLIGGSGGVGFIGLDAYSYWGNSESPSRVVCRWE